MMTQPAVLYADVLKQQCRLLYGAETPNRIDDYVSNSAKRIHALMIWDASQNAFLQAATLSSAIYNERARYLVQFGASRRLEMIWYAFRNLTTIAAPDRSDPLESDESRQLMLDINTIYLNIRGTLDNLAWALLWEFSLHSLKSLRPSQVGLFLPGIRSNSVFLDLKTLIDLHDSWDRELKARRDPAAHGIPLALPPAVLNPEQTAQYRDLEVEYGAAMQRREFELADQILSS